MATSGSGAPAGASGMQRLAAWSQRHHWLALAVWVLVLVGVTAVAQGIGDDYYDDHTLPGTESQELSDTLAEHAPQRSGASIEIVVQDPAGLTDQATRDRVTAMLGDVAGLARVVDVTDPYESEHAISDDETIGHARVSLDAVSTDVPAGAVEDIIDTAKAAEGDDLRVELGGDPVRGVEEAEGFPAEAAGILAALVILIFMFGSVLAASLPVITAIFAVGSTVGVMPSGTSPAARFSRAASWWPGSARTTCSAALTMSNCSPGPCASACSRHAWGWSSA